MTHASLCTGIGGFDIAASWMGWDNIFQCEIDPFCRRVLQYWFPQCELFSDIKTSDFSKYANTIDIISAGIPCQPFSVAGKRKGTRDDRYLWDEVYRAICEVRPRWFVGENVGGLLTQQSGMVFERVCADLENAGYGVQSFVIPACSVGAPHRRDRVFIVANLSAAWVEGMQHERKNGISGFKTFADASSDKNIRRRQGGFYSEPSGFNVERITTDATGIGQQRREQTGTKRKMEEQSGRFHSSYNQFYLFPTQSPVCNRNDGFSGGLAGITFSKWRREAIKAMGNAVVPQVVYQIFKGIEKVEQIKNQ